MTALAIAADGPTLVLTGDFDVRSTSEARDAIYEHLERWDGDIVIDLHGVGNVDLTALRVLGAASRFSSRNDDHIVLRGASPAVIRMLHLTHLIRVVDLERQPLAV